MAILNQLKKLGVKNIEYFSKGKRGIIYTGLYKGKKVAIKTKKKESEAVGRIRNEYLTLKKINKYNIGPKVISFHKGKTEKDSFMMYYFVEGEFIYDYLEKANKKNIKEVLRNVFMQCYMLDKLGINKEEMSRPKKHLLVKNNTPTFLDFERSHITQKPQNVTQFVQFIIGKKNSIILRKKGFRIDRSKIIALSKVYKKRQTKANLDKIYKLGIY